MVCSNTFYGSRLSKIDVSLNGSYFLLMLWIVKIIHLINVCNRHSHRNEKIEGNDLIVGRLSQCMTHTHTLTHTVRTHWLPLAHYCTHTHTHALTDLSDLLCFFPILPSSFEWPKDGQKKRSRPTTILVCVQLACLLLLIQYMIRRKMAKSFQEKNVHRLKISVEGQVVLLFGVAKFFAWSIIAKFIGPCVCMCVCY